MNKQEILNLTGLTENEFYNYYPDQESFCNDYPEACDKLQEAQNGIQVYTSGRQLTPTGQNNSFYNNTQNITPEQLMEAGKKYGWRTDNARNFQEDMYKHISSNNPELMKQMINKYGAAKAGFVNYNGVQSFAPDNMLGARSAAIFNDFQKTTAPSKKIRYELLNSPNYYKDNFGKTSAQKIYKPIFEGNWNKSEIDSAFRNGIIPDTYGPGTTVLKGQPYWEVEKNTEYQNTKPNPVNYSAANRQPMSPANTMRSVSSTNNPFRINRTPAPEIANTNYNNLMRKYGGPLIPEYKTGGNWIQSAVKHPGRCTPGSPNYDCPKGSPQWNLAQTFKKHHGFHEEGGNVFPAMRNFKHGGYYGMDGKFHKNSDSGTYVSAGGYYFKGGGPKINDGEEIQISPDNGFVNTWNTNNNQDNSQYYSDRSNVIETSDASDPYDITNNKSSFIDRWNNGKTKFQKTMRGISDFNSNLIGIGDLITNSMEQSRLNDDYNNSLISQGSTDSIFSNAPSASKGDYDPNTGKKISYSNMSFKGMYGKYGMEVPKYAVGGFEPQIETLADYGLESPEENIPVPINYESLYSLPSALHDNTRVAPPVVPLNSPSYTINKNRSIDGPIDVDLALQAVSGHESGVKPGQTKVGFRTRLIGKGGKRATASGTYQITTDTLKQIFKNDKNLRSNFKTFNEFKSAFDTNPDVEYAAARSLMSDHIKNYGVYALGAWYQPAFAKRAMEGDKSVFNIIPRKDYGNKLKWGVDFKNKLNSYNKLAGTNYEIMKYGGQQLGGQVVEMDENEIQQFLKAGGQLEFLD